jgi:zinc and cadmium transporter
MQNFLYAMVAVFAVSAISLVGAVFIFREKLLRKIMFALVSFAAGTMLGAAFFDLLPEASKMGADVFALALAGVLVFFVLEKFICWRHCHKGRCDVHPFTYLNLVGDGVHNFVDGVIIAASFISDASLGIVSTIAVAAHEVPQELGDFGILIYGGLSKTKALEYNFLSALTAVAGALATYFFFASPNAVAFLLPFAAGGFIYIACVDLFPKMHEEVALKVSVVQLALLLAGIGFIGAITTLLE